MDGKNSKMELLGSAPIPQALMALGSVAWRHGHHYAICHHLWQDLCHFLYF